MKTLLITVLLCIATYASAAVTNYNHGETLVIELYPNLKTGNDHIRNIIFLGANKLRVDATWNPQDLLVIQNGNMIRLSLRNENIEQIPVGVQGDNGVFYHLVVKPAKIDARLEATVNIIASKKITTKDSDSNASIDPNASGGSWEHNTNTIIRLHKHIRGARQYADTLHGKSYNAEMMLTQAKRVPGKVWTQNDDWSVLEYQWWEMGNVRAYMIGVTYTGREDKQYFSYLQHQTDNLLSIYKVTQPGDRPLYAKKNPGSSIYKGVEQFFILYTEMESK